VSLLVSRKLWLLIIVVGCASVAGGFAVDELRSSTFQSHYFSELSRGLTFKLAPGASPSIRFPTFGPYDERLGYSRIPDFTKSLLAHDYQISQQARMSPQLVALALPPIYREKDQAGLALLDCNQQSLYSARSPGRVYDSFDTIPKVLVESLLFIEDRELLDARYPNRNPAVNWSRFNRALLDQVVHVFVKSHDTPGASTLITQIEKYRHSRDGRTSSAQEKLSQMESASIRAYANGENTLLSRRQTVVEYLNTVPLTAKSGFGEINGLGDGMWAWYGRDFTEVNRVLSPANLAVPLGKAQLLRTAQIYKQALSLMIAQRRPSYYLREGAAGLERLTNSHLRLLGAAGIISPALLNAALPLKLELKRGPVNEPVASFVTRKAVTALRADLSGLLHVSRLYDLDRLDLTVKTTLNGEIQSAVTKVLRQVKTAAGARKAELYGHNMLKTGDDPGKLTFSFTLFERGADANLLRVQTDNLDQPFDINDGARLNLGSTAKLRTVVTYLEIITQLHQRYAGMTPDELKQVKVDQHDPLSRWALEYFAGAPDKSLRATLYAAMERKYSGDPAEVFFTGGGLQQFENFDPEENGKMMTVREGFQHSVNLVFVRLMRDIVRHYKYNTSDAAVEQLADSDAATRQATLSRFADKEGREFLARFYKKYAGKTSQEAEDLLLETIHPTPRRLAVLYRSIEPSADLAQFSGFIHQHFPQAKESDKTLQALYEKVAVEKLSLPDRGYLAGVHPLELWLVGFLRHHQNASLSQAVVASRDERQASYEWLFKTPNRKTQDKRIQQMLELEAFLEIARDWHRLGYPFEALTPSYATALGASGDRPASLAALMGIIVNKGVQLPVRKLESMDFARGTPYETHFVHGSRPARRLLPEEIIEVVRRSLIDVVQGGTARRLKDGFVQANGTSIEVGGKTGTGDQRFASYAPGGRLISSRAVNRSATFVFLLGDRFFGTMTAYVHEPYAADYRFTSAMSVQLLKYLAPTLQPLVERTSNGETLLLTKTISSVKH